MRVVPAAPPGVEGPPDRGPPRRAARPATRHPTRQTTTIALTLKLLLRLLWTTALWLPALCWAQAEEVRREQLPMSFTLGVESVRLPQGEHMGLMGGTALFDIGSDFGLGPAVYGAVSGHRGGLFVGGVELQRRWGLAPGLCLSTGLFAGGGGGAGAPVGGGLMLRPALTLLQDWGPFWQVGLSWSSVRFPSGQIASNQLGLTLAWRSDFVYYTGHGNTWASAWSEPTGLGFDRMAATVSRYKLKDGSARNVGLAGARAERRTDVRGLTWGMEAAAAAQGHAAGYMEILGTAAWSVAPLGATVPSWRLGLRGGLGAAGGGAVPTQGGLISKATGTTEWEFARGWTVGAEFGLVHGVRSPLRAEAAQVWVATSLEPEGRGQALSEPVRTEWVGALHHHTRVLRNAGIAQSLDTIGLELDRYVGEHVYLTGQAHSAFAGAAGAYSIGLVGAGVAATVGPRLRVGAEGLVGAAGGGGVSTAGGAIAQGMAWVGVNTSPLTQWRVAAGATRTRHAAGTSGLFELSWSHAFGMSGR